MSVKTNDAGETNGGEGRIVRVASTDTMGQPITLELPIHNVVFPTDFKSYIANHGQDVLHDSATGEEGLVQEIVALAGVEPDIVVENRGEFAAVLEGLTLRIDDLRAARKGLRDLLDQDGLDALDARYQGNPGAAANLPVKAIKGVGKHLAKVLGENATIAALAEKGFSEVLEAALKDVPENQKRRTERVLGKTYATALLIVRQGELYRKK